jgi:hypothetical protein
MGVSSSLPKPPRGNFVCPETLDNMQVEQAVRVFLKYADNHPEDLHYPAANVVWLAMHDAFPCPAK